MAGKTVTAELSSNAGDETAAENEMGTLPIGKLLRKMSLPLIISMLVQVLYGLVDSMYVARLGDSALTAISLCMPVQYLAVGIGIGLGVGVNSVLSKKLGEGDKQGVNRAAGNGMLLIWLVSVAFVFIGLFAMEPFYRMQTDIAEVLEMSISYSEIISVLAFAALHQVMIERLLSATGKANLTMVSMLVGAVVNIVLDPVMIFGWFGIPAMGIAGAAYAAVIAQIAAASLLLTTTTQILTGFLQALGWGTDSFIIVVSQAVFLLLSAWLLSLSGSAFLVWLAFPIMEILRFLSGRSWLGKHTKSRLRRFRALG